MNRRPLVTALVAITLCSSSVAGCGDDSDSGSGAGTAGSGGAVTGGTGGASSEGGAGGGQSGGTGGAGSTGGSSSVLDDIRAGLPCDPTANTTCQNETSCPDVLSGQGLLIAHSAVETCATRTEEYCIEVGVANGTELSSRCESCYAELALCMAAGCDASCGIDAFSTGCVSCRDTQGCTAAFDVCAEL